MGRPAILALVLSHAVLLYGVCAGQSPRSIDQPRFDDLLARAAHGDAAAQLKLADAYLGRAVQTGVVVKPDSAEALRWLLEAAKQNNTDALMELGSGYEYGYFGQTDGSKAARYYRRAAELGNSSAAVDLTHLYTEGAEGLPPNFDEAARWAKCPKPSTISMHGCRSISHDLLPKPALALLRHLQCDVGSNYDYGTEIHLRAGTDSPYYQVCCHDAPHGPCTAVLIGEIAGRWTNLTDRFGLFGFVETCGGMMVLESTHVGFHDLCLPTQCSSSRKNGCRPEVLEFNGTRYAATSAVQAREENPEPAKR